MDSLLKYYSMPTHKTSSYVALWHTLYTKVPGVKFHVICSHPLRVISSDLSSCLTPSRYSKPMRRLLTVAAGLLFLLLNVEAMLALLLEDCFGSVTQTLRAAPPEIPRAKSALDKERKRDKPIVIMSYNDSNGVTISRSVDYSDVLMPSVEIDTVVKHLLNVDTYLEWGSGGSTLNFAPFARISAHSIEHDAGWCDRLLDKLNASAEYARIHYHCVRVENGYRHWGKSSSFEEGTYYQFDKYVDLVDNLGVKAFDFVLIDGRARVPAAIKVLAYVTPESRVVLHDAARLFEGSMHHPKYDAILTYYNFVELVVPQNRPGIAVMARKPEWHFLEGNVSAVNDILNKQPW